MSVTLLLLFLTLPMVSSHELRRRRSVAPFLGSGGSSSKAMLIPKNLWHCGSDGFTSDYSYSVVEESCPTLAAAINHCCAIHDDCYGQQFPREMCDQDFCKCTKDVTRLPTAESTRCRPFMEKEACLAIEFGGFFAYLFSNYSDPSSPSNNDLVVLDNTPESDYMNLYSMCPFANITLASCAVNFNLCSSVHSVDFCAADLCHCTMDAADTDVLHNDTCLPAVTHTCRAVLSHSSRVLASQNTRNLFIIVLSVLTIVSLGFVGIYMFTKSKGSSKMMEEGKYLQIHTVESARSVNPLLTNTD
ncbi:hypothetical protein GCK72_005049 [Caenorhabditis remanei]|uniref:Uncharacterized protein n=1 Tax=Caenorhabditis remanei TaxID=31234 RepID=A0A6A5HD65_CAERE|nr:hypothetical protein GCK72_005049 [Caenorhabditis remanei]KAF1765097.1 hypothetical protein GCK72_005049 [Caenorhabditis remanei]